MNVKTTFPLALLFVFWSSAAADTSDKSTPTEQALGLETKYEMAKEAAKPDLLNAFEDLAQANPENADIISRFVRLLYSHGDYSKAIAYLEPLNSTAPSSSLMLQECMLKDRVGKKEEGCYQRVLGLPDGELMDHMMALYFTDEAKFHARKAHLLKLHPELKSDFAIFEQDKLNILRSLYP